MEKLGRGEAERLVLIWLVDCRGRCHVALNEGSSTSIAGERSASAETQRRLRVLLLKKVKPIKAPCLPMDICSFHSNFSSWAGGKNGPSQERLCGSFL